MLGKLHIELLVYPKVNSKHIDKLFPKSTIFMVNIIPGNLYGIGFATEVLLGFPQRLSTLRLASATAQSRCWGRRGLLQGCRWPPAIGGDGWGETYRYEWT